MTTGRINQVNGGIQRRKPSNYASNRHGGPEGPAFDKREIRVASLFPPWPEGQCLAPSADGRGPSRDSIRPMPVREPRKKLPRAKDGESPVKATREIRIVKHHRRGP